MEFKFDAYEGPLDLLLKLIQRHEIDIYDIPIATLTDQYMQEIANLPPDMGELSEFLVMAATLLEIKSRMLLPRPKKEEDEPEEDPRDALVQKLLAYKQAQVIAEMFKTRAPIGESLTNRGDREILAEMREEAKSQFETDITTITQLMDIFVEAMNRKDNRRDVVRAGYGRMARDRFTITEKVWHMRHLLIRNGHASLRSLFTDCRSKNEMVVTFLALLELVRQGEASASQDTSFGDVVLTPCDPTKMAEDFAIAGYDVE